MARRWSSARGKYITVENSERQRKSDLVTAAAAARGLTLKQNYRDGTNLYVGGGEWSADIGYGSNQPFRGSVNAESFEELLATFTDDAKYASYVYRHCPTCHRLAEEERQASHEYSRAKTAYGTAAIALVVGRLKLAEPTQFDALEDALAKAHQTLTDAFLAHQWAYGLFQTYLAAEPTTPEGIAAYLEAIAPEQPAEV